MRQQGDHGRSIRRPRARGVLLWPALFALGAIGASRPAPQMSYLDNGMVRIGVDLAMGGVITYFSRSSQSASVVNVHDLGREIQQSYYSGPTPYGESHPAFPDWPWNPIGAGDIYGNPSRVTASRNDGKTIYVRTVPMQWALDLVPCECHFETWITLDGYAANVRYRLTNHRNDDLTQYPPYGQELPAVYTIGRLHRIVTYDGPEPFSNAPVREAPSNYASYTPTENWMALLDDSGWGLGVLNANADSFVAWFYGKPGAGGPEDDATGYLAPRRAETLDHNITYSHDASLILGTLSEIRAYAIAHQPRDMRPDHRFDVRRFEEDRQHFRYVNARDTGLPFKGGLRVLLDQRDPQIWLPAGRWEAGALPVVYVTAAFHTQDTLAEVFWSMPGETFSASRRVGFAVIPDGEFHTYAVHLDSSREYRGVITGLRLDPGNGGRPGEYVDIASISYRPTKD